MYKSLPIQLLLVIVGVLLFGNFIPHFVVELLYTFSFIFKEILEITLPFIIFSFVLTGILSLKKNVPLVLLVLLSTIFFSNVIVACVAYGIMYLVLPVISCEIDMQQFVSSGNILEPLIQVTFPRLVPAEQALILAIVLGLFLSAYRIKQVEEWIYNLKRAIELFLLYCFIPLLPVYVLGFLLKLHYEGMISVLMKHYSWAFLLIIFMQITYLLSIYFIAAGFSFIRARKAIINALPSYLTAFGTMSSTVTVPISVESAVKNTGSQSLANIAMPIMANVHLLGDSIGTPILALVTMSLFFNCLPNLISYLTFVLYFGVSMFAVSGIPGGGILVVIPVLVSTFGFTPAMVSLITALYLLLDPFGTAANVMGDGALVMLVHRLLRRFGLLE